VNKILVPVGVLVIVALGAYWWLFWHVTPPDIPFAPNDTDFARLEHAVPLTPADLQKLTPRNLTALTQEQVDQVYARLTPGPIPDTVFDGALFFPRGANRSRFAEVVGGGMVGGLKGRAIEIGVARIDVLGERLWRGKVFDREARILRNRISDLRALDLLLDDVEEQQLDALEDEALGQYLLFPAKLYCGQSLLDARRESIIIDYAYTDDLPGYLETLDHLVGREGLRIRDEIRMVRPGFYLGRAYMDRVFALNFTLYNEAIAEASEGISSEAAGQDCWTGEQRRVAAR
jgi:hypothetical protein